MGGKSTEREVSLSTGRMILGAIDSCKYHAFAVDTGTFGEAVPAPGGKPIRMAEGAVDLSAVISGGPEYRPDVAFIALHGRFGEDGTIQGLMELLGIPYVGSGVLASALAMDKIMTNRVLACRGIRVPKNLVARAPVNMDALKSAAKQELGFPVVVKPNRQGSTIGLGIAKTEEDFERAVEVALAHDGELLLEEFIKGCEVTCPVLGNGTCQALPVIEIIPASGFYDYHAKYTPGATEEIVPARLPKDIYTKVQEIARECHAALSCRGMSRTDMIVGEGGVTVLEVNTIPGMTPTSLLPRAAEAAGIKFPNLIDRLIQYALEKE
jgi:D-alanine-D-alanine ligase